jgi:hypothetical protein
MVARIVGYLMLLAGAVGLFTQSDSDVRYPAAVLGAVGVIAILEGTIAQIVAAVRERNAE